MNHANYKKWLQEKFIPNLECKSVIVVDNASYHNVQLNRHPTSNARKGETPFWLDKHGIRCSSDRTKAELYDLIKMSFVLFYVNVLLVCKYVLYYCHRVSTQLQLTNISYHNTGNN